MKWSNPTLEGLVRRRDRPKPPPDQPIRQAVTDVGSYVRRRSSALTGQSDSATRGLSDLLSTKGLSEYLRASHVFILGKIGLYETVLNALWEQVLSNKLPIQPIHMFRSRRSRTVQPVELLPSMPIVLVPIAESVELVNLMVTKAIRSGSPAWLVTYPSLLNKQLLVQFHSFFVFQSSWAEMTVLEDILQLNSGDLTFLKSDEDSHALFVSDFYLQEKEHGWSQGMVVRLENLG